VLSCPPISRVSLPVTTLNTPAGTPARRASSAKARAVSGVWLAGLTTMLQPAASAGPALRVIIAAGKFQGVMAAQTPIGSFSTTMRWVSFGAGITSPRTRLASSENHCRNDAAYWTSVFASASGLPSSSVIKVARSSPCRTTRSYQRRSTSDRCLAVVRRHSRKARCATAIACAVSSCLKRGRSTSGSSVAGLRKV